MINTFIGNLGHFMTIVAFVSALVTAYAYIQYFKANENFEKRLSFRTHRASRKWLREIRRLSKIRGDEIHEKFKTKTEAKKS